jgi:hypothetical protein
MQVQSLYDVWLMREVALKISLLKSASDVVFYFPFTKEFSSMEFDMISLRRMQVQSL